jgi:hypothetical protein
MAEPHGESAHEQAETLLPWYATGQLDAADRTLVEAHLSFCARCQAELKEERRLIDEYRSLAPEVDTSWAHLKARLEPRRVSRPSLGRALQEIWNMFSRPAVAVLATAQLAFLLIAGVIFLSISRPGPTYRTLGASEAPRTANVIVIFRPDATEEDMRDALRTSGGTLVGGPTGADAYLVNVPPNRRASALASLQSDENVRMAEPIDGAAR